LFEGGLHPSFGVDALSAFFLAVLATVAVPVLIYMRGYLRGAHHGDVIAALTFLFIGALVLVVTARDILTFLAGWELMTLIPAAIILVNRADRPTRRTAFIYLAVTHVGGVGVWVTLLQLTFVGRPSGVIATVVLVTAALVGFGTKAGLMPFHSWLPRAHPSAPSPVSALMSGVMIKVALYGLIRVILASGINPVVWGESLLALGVLSAIGGVVYALFQHELKQLLAFHSIENIGIIAMGLGSWLVLEGQGQRFWGGVAFVAAMLHVLNHAVFKSLLFMGAGAIERATQAHDLDHIGGLFRRMPWTGGTFLIGSMAIAGLPPLNGFVSEWLTFQSLIHGAGLNGIYGVSCALAAAGLAATAALAVLCFVKVCGLVLLGAPRTDRARDAKEVAISMRIGMAMLAGLCVLLGVAPGLWLSNLPGTGGLPAVSVFVLIAGFTALLTWVRGARTAAPAPAWTSGQTIDLSLGWTSSGFTKPLRLGWQWLLRPQNEVAVVRSHAIVRSVTYRGDVPHLFDTAFYSPLLKRAAAWTGHVRRLQSGSLRTYSIYLSALVVFALALLRLGLL
jgi:hydrogenase-4 component B